MKDKLKERERLRKYALDHPDKVRAAKLKWYNNNKVKANEINKRCSAKRSEISRATTNARKRQLYRENPQLKIRSRNWKRANKDKVRNTCLKAKYGLTLEQYNQLLADQEYKCKICSKKTILIIDHCHKTGKFRGLLCARCNHMLGHSLDNPITLRLGANYLEANQ